MGLPLAGLFSLEGRVAVVTGGSSGLGRTIALTLAEAGAHITLVARDRARLEEAAAAVEALGRRAAWLEADMADTTRLPEVARQAAALGAPDIVVHAAGINRRPPLDALTPEDWDVTLAVNLTAPHRLSQAFAPAMVARGWGRFIHLASLQSVRALGNSGAYGVSKAGIAQLARVQAEAWSRHGVNSNAIAPGFFPTPLTRAVFDDPARAAALAARTMIGRNGALEDIRGAALFLASRASDYVTGQLLFVDGGFSAG
jgi:NAD(P)-dependent dehydrogenase (short-subunit alcohol dehydrogenase family)